MTGFVVTCLTFDGLPRRSMTFDRFLRRSPDFLQVSPLLFEPPIGFTVAFQTFDGLRHISVTSTGFVEAVFAGDPRFGGLPEVVVFAGICIKDSWLLLFPNPRRLSSLFWLRLLPQLLSPLVQILALPPLWMRPLVLSRIYFILSLYLAYCSLNWGPCFSSNHQVLLLLWLQDWISKKIFGKGYERDGLYYFGDPPCIPSLSGLDVATIPANLDRLPRPIPLFDSPPVHVPPASSARTSLKVYTRRAPPWTPLPNSSSVSNTSPSNLVSTSHSVILLALSFIGQVASILIPRSVSEALQNLQWVAVMQEEMDALERNGT
ncbi:S-adenosylmethionine carrier 2 [Actinidia rufa]|uniref:S-adenosylmethionine carrier 2 n=1 Tax=Actinidia rufa TaxID=165716 RepID=A0A7J0EXL5_9ERIC|nr:S-adenosylmethionine carrier 2 [Actinidia rufa]